MSNTKDRWIILESLSPHDRYPWCFEITPEKPNRPLTYATETEALRDLAAYLIQSLQGFLADTGDFPDLKELDCCPCLVLPDGRIVVDENYTYHPGK